MGLVVVVVVVQNFQREIHLRLKLRFSFFLLEEMGVVTVAELKTSISGKRSFRPSSSIRHATEW